MTEPFRCSDGACVSGSAECVDTDRDGITDGADCAPGNQEAFLPPPEAGGLRFAVDGVTLSWDSLAALSGTGTVYDVLRGSLSDLPVGAASEFCLEIDSLDLLAFDIALPALGTGFYYAVRGDNVCAKGTYGFTSSGVERLSLACP